MSNRRRLRRRLLRLGDGASDLSTLPLLKSPQRHKYYFNFIISRIETSKRKELESMGEKKEGREIPDPGLEPGTAAPEGLRWNLSVNRNVTVNYTKSGTL